MPDWSYVNGVAVDCDDGGSLDFESEVPGCLHDVDRPRNVRYKGRPVPRSAHVPKRMYYASEGTYADRVLEAHDLALSAATARAHKRAIKSAEAQIIFAPYAKETKMSVTVKTVRKYTKPGLRHVVELMFDGSSKRYMYLSKDRVTVGDPVIVLASGEFKVVRVSRIEGFSKREREMASAYIVQPISTAAYRKNTQEEVLIQEIKAKLAAKREEMEEYAIYEQLAKHDPSINDLLLQLKGLTLSAITAPEAETDTE